MRSLLAILHRRARAATTRAIAFEMAGEALHLIQDSYSLAHVLRTLRASLAGPHPIRYVRYFGFLTKFPPRRTTPPNEHGFPSDGRDGIFSAPGRLKHEANIAVAASVDYLRMLVAQRARAPSPRDALELRRFLNRHFLTGAVIAPHTFHSACGSKP
jgi:hypothetical protein